MVLFPMSGVLRGIAPAAFEEAVCGVPLVRLNENPCPPSRRLRRGGRACVAVLIKKNSSFLNWKLTPVFIDS